MNGRRIPDGEWQAHAAQPGDYCRTGEHVVWAMTPTGEYARFDERWTITENPDGTLTINDSLRLGQPGEPGHYHGTLTGGVWLTHEDSGP